MSEQTDNERHMHYAIIANITETPDATGRPGCKHFAPRTKVIVHHLKISDDKRWQAQVIGRHRGGRVITYWINAKYLTNLRVKLEYSRNANYDDAYRSPEVRAKVERECAWMRDVLAHLPQSAQMEG